MSEVEQIRQLLDELEKKTPQAPMDQMPLIAWMMRGLIGGVGLLKAIVETGQQLPDVWADEMRRCGEVMLNLSKRN